MNNPMELLGLTEVEREAVLTVYRQVKTNIEGSNYEEYFRYRRNALQAAIVYSLRHLDFTDSGLSRFTLNELSSAYEIGRKQIGRIYRLLIKLGYVAGRKDSGMGDLT